MGVNQKAKIFLKECMADALINAMQTKELGKITINEIAQQAGVNRSTWFRSFEEKTDALTFKLVVMWDRYAQEHKLAQRNKYSLDNAVDFFTFNYEVRELLKVIYNAGVKSCIYDAFYQIMMEKYNDTVHERYAVKYYSYALFGLLDEWINRDFKESSMEITRMFYDILHVTEVNL